MSQGKRKKLGELLVERNLVLPEQVEAALKKQKATGRRLGQVLVDMGFVSHDDILDSISIQMGIPHIWLRKGLVDPVAAKLFPKEKCTAYSVLPMFKVHNTLTVAMSDASSLFVIDDVEQMTGLKVQPVQCRQDDIKTMIDEIYGASAESNDFLDSFSDNEVTVAETLHEDLSMVQEQAEGARVINLVNLLVLNAIKDGVSDVHIEPDLHCTRVRYRVDGALQEVMTPGADIHPAIVSRVKVMAKLDIAERRMPQDGRIRAIASGKEIDIRVSTMPTVLGEKVVMRLLDKGRMPLDLDRIGFDPETLASTKRILKRPHGMLLVTGPTGSGKTTTLYCGLNYISSMDCNIVTIEDPVEYQLPLINQVQVHEDQELTFARILRSVLRQDPDVVMVGEIRDRDTAEVAVQAALTGHLVLSTLHTNESAGAVARLIEMGIEPFLVTSALAGVIAQRLVRTICTDCKTPYFPPREMLETIGWRGTTSNFATGKGCGKCFGTGLRGRAGVHELLTITDAVRDAILRGASIHELRRAAAESGMNTMKDSAFRLVEKGETTLEEVMRVVLVENRADEPAIKATA